MKVLWLGAAAAAISFCLTELVRRYALARSLVDVPNERSSHEAVTPRGGGLAVVIVFIGAVVAAVKLANLNSSTALAVCSGGILVASIGFVDDHRDVAIHWRLLLHFLAAATAIVLLYQQPGFSLSMLGGLPSWLAGFIAAVFVVWLVNIYNFMDGIDGIASIEAISVGLGGALLFALGDLTSGRWILPVLLLASVAGFLFWNYPPARIFMGDVGSGFLGFVLAVLCLDAASVSSEMFWAWIILLGVFIVDTGVALLRRFLQGERIHQAHRSHAYQHAALKYKGHAPVTLAVGALNVFWLLPLALFVASSRLSSELGVFIAYLPLFFLAVKFGSGKNSR